MKITVGGKLAANTAVICLMLVVAGGIVYSKLAASRLTQQDIVDIRWPVEMDLSAIISNLNHARADLREAMLFRNDADKVTKAHASRKACFRLVQEHIDHLATLAPRFARAENRERVRYMQEDFPAIDQLQDQAEAAALRGDMTSVAEELKEAAKVSSRSRKAIDDFMDSSTILTSQMLRSSGDQTQSAIFWLFLALLLSPPWEPPSAISSLVR
jgi:hypothetical protein